MGVELGVELGGHLNMRGLDREAPSQSSSSFTSVGQVGVGLRAFG